MLKRAAEVINNLIAEITDEISKNKEREAERETFPPAPPIEGKGKGKKTAATAARARACTREGCSYLGPSWDDVLAYAKHPKVKIDPDYALWWFDQMSAMGWCNPDSITEPLGNWKAMLRKWKTGLTHFPLLKGTEMSYRSERFNRAMRSFDAECSPCPLSQAVLLLILRDCGYVAPTLVAIATHRDREEAICSLD